MSKLRKAAQAVVGCMDAHGLVLQHRIEALRDALMQEDALVCLSETHQQLASELGEVEKAWPEARAAESDQQLCRDAEPVRLYVRAEAYEYDFWGDVELWGVVTGAPGGRWSIQQVNPAAVYPVGTALYVRRKK